MATLCTYVRLFARPGTQGLRQPGALLMLPFSAWCMHVGTVLRFKTHPLPIVLGRRNGNSRDQRLCRQCDLHAVHDKRHLVFGCLCGINTLLGQPCKEYHAAVYVAACIKEVAHYMMDCSYVFNALSDAPDGASISWSVALALDRCKSLITQWLV